ncbi:uncharacterized protein EDB91DRAFT_1238363 [Suillus paluster]|uniref:uncharacterized protein n=1 Tax=Suillus paluster TaxID=48578 RepID=UPI001B884291|nr:uncharacterized protein EDB91DRAFT_1238363 [Suillus paluster]KAG1734683.1 hypothetical protein EDB91DRAFT_1238363 [Suillus paluster]
MPSSEPSTAVLDHQLIRSSPTFPTNPCTLADVNEDSEEVAQSIALRMITDASTISGARISVHSTLSKEDDTCFLQLVTCHIRECLPLSRYLFAVATIGASTSNTLVICWSIPHVQRAALLASSRFLGRVDAVQNTGTPFAQAASLERMTPQRAYDVLHDSTSPVPVFLVDIHTASQRDRDGVIHRSLIIERNVLEWRFDPRCEVRLAIADRYDSKIILHCHEGYISSFAAASFHELGLLNATNIMGGHVT